MSTLVAHNVVNGAPSAQHGATLRHCLRPHGFRVPPQQTPTVHARTVSHRERDMAPAQQGTTSGGPPWHMKTARHAHVSITPPHASCTCHRRRQLEVCPKKVSPSSTYPADLKVVVCVEEHVLRVPATCRLEIHLGFDRPRRFAGMGKHAHTHQWLNAQAEAVPLCQLPPMPCAPPCTYYGCSVI